MFKWNFIILHNLIHYLMIYGIEIKNIYNNLCHKLCHCLIDNLIFILHIILFFKRLDFLIN